MNTPGRADLDQVAAELALQHAVFVPAEIDVVVGAEDVQVAPAGVVAVEAHAAVALDAAVHLVVDERPEVLVAVGALVEAVLAGSCGRSSRSCPAGGTRRPRRRPGSRADG